MKKNIYMGMAKASFSAYVLGKHLLKTGEEVYFLGKKSTTNFGRPFCSFPFPFLASKWLKYAVFALQKAKKVYIYIWQRARLPPQILAFLALFPSLKVKNGKFEMCKFAPSLRLRF